MAVAKPLLAAKQQRARAALVLDLRPEFLGLAAIVVVALTSLLYLTQASNVAATGYEITYAQDRRDKLERELQSLKVRASRLQALDRLEQEATNKLGLVPAPLPEFLPSREAPVDVEAALARAEREARRQPKTWSEQVGAALRWRQPARTDGGSDRSALDRQR